MEEEKSTTQKQSAATPRGADSAKVIPVGEANGDYKSKPNSRGCNRKR